MHETLIPKILLRDILGQGGTLDPFGWDTRLTFFSLGRMALLHGVKLLAAQKTRKNEILVPAYLCEETLWPLREAGYRPRYYSIDDNWTPDPEEIGKKITENTLATIVIHYFGIPQKIAQLKEICEKKGIYLIEDCAHALYGKDGKYWLGSRGDISFFSVRKFLPIPDGGVLAINNTRLLESATDLRMVPNRRKTAWLKLIVRSVINQLKSAGILESAFGSDAENIEQLCPRANLDKEKREFVENETMSKLSRALFNRYDLVKMAARRRNNYNRLAITLQNIDGIHIPYPKMEESWNPYVLPLYVKDDLQFRALKSLVSNGVMATDWPTLPLDLEGPMKQSALALQKRIILLPIHQHLGEREVDYIAQIVRRSVK